MRWSGLAWMNHEPSGGQISRWRAKWASKHAGGTDMALRLLEYLLLLYVSIACRASSHPSSFRALEQAEDPRAISTTIVLQTQIAYVSSGGLPIIPVSP